MRRNPDGSLERSIDDVYSQPAVKAGKHARLFDALASDVASPTRIVQGLAAHERGAAAFCGVEVPDKRLSESHIRPVERLPDCLLAIDSRPLCVARPVDRGGQPQGGDDGLVRQLRRSDRRRAARRRQHRR
jgi:hypothetical protein